MQLFKKQSKISSLVSRLRDLEAEALRLATSDVPADRLPIKNLYKDRLNSLENAHSHSWFGDHSSTYFMGFQTPPAGQSFDVEWGFIPGFHGRRNRDWRIYSRDEIRAFLSHDIGEDIHYELNALAEKLVKDLSDLRDQSLDVLEALSHQIKTEALTRYATRLKNELVSYKIVDFINSKSKSAPKVTRDSEEIMKGQIVPAHIQLLASFSSIAANKSKLQDLANILRNTIQATTLHESEPSGGDVPNKIFIGHGKSEQWRILKDFLRDRLNLPYEEFNRISAAGINTQERLSEMLDECGFAFLVLAGEDLHGDGSVHARENVIHESGLFQGRLGWRKAIILLEEGCQEFSNIVGLGQIRFAKSNIQSCFEEVRHVLEREGLLVK
jgi:predicted nucleotide-binding protein